MTALERGRWVRGLCEMVRAWIKHSSLATQFLDLWYRFLLIMASGGNSVVAPWSPQEDAVLKIAQNSGKSAATILREGILPGRSKRGISQRLTKFARLGLTDQADGLAPVTSENTSQCEPSDYIKQCMQDEAAAREKADAEAQQRWNRISSRSGGKNIIADVFSTKTSQLAATWSEVKGESEESADEEIVRFTTSAGHLRSSPPTTPIQKLEPVVSSSPGDKVLPFFTPDPPEVLVASVPDSQNTSTTQPGMGVVEVPSTQLSDVEPTTPQKRSSRGRRYAKRTDLGHLTSSPASNDTHSDDDQQSDRKARRKRRKTCTRDQPPSSKAKRAASEASDKLFQQASHVAMLQMRERDQALEEQALIEKRAKAHKERRAYIKMGLPLSPHDSDSTEYSGDDETDDEG